MDSPLEFFAFGMDRELPAWAPMQYNKPILHLGPGKKGDRVFWPSQGDSDAPEPNGTYDLEWPQYDFDHETPLTWYPGKSDMAGCFIENGTVGGVIATHVLEHLRDPRPLIWDVARVLASGAPFNIVVPKAGTNLFWQDLDHKTGFVLDTWKTLFDNSYYSKGKNRKMSSVFDIGFNAEMAIKEGNVAIVTQLIKL